MVAGRPGLSRRAKKREQKKASSPVELTLDEPLSIDSTTNDALYDRKVMLLLVVVSFVAFGNTLTAEFCWDDRVAVLSNADVISDSVSIYDIFSHDFWGNPMSSSSSHKSYRPLTVLSFRINRIVTGLESFHAINLLLHTLAAVLMYQCALKLLINRTVSAWSAFLFLLHPVHCDAVASIVGRADILCTVAFFLTYLAHDKSLTQASYSWFAASLSGIIAASLCKELGITISGILFVIEAQYFWIKKPQVVVYAKNAWFRCTTLVLLVLTFVKLRLYFLHGNQALYQWTALENHLSLLPWGKSRVLSTAYTHAIYLLKLVWPQKLCYDYGFNQIELITTVLDPRNVMTFVAYAFVLRTVYSAVTRSTSNDCPLLIMVAIAILPFIPAANILFPVGTIVAERLLYFPSVGFCLYVPWKCICDSSSVVTGVSNRYRNRLWNGIYISVLGLCFFKTIERNSQWRNERVLFKSALDVSPKSVKVLSNLAKVYLNPKEAHVARDLLEEAVALYPNHATGHLNLGIAYYLLDKPLHSIQHYENSLALSDGNPFESATARGYLGEQYLFLYKKSDKAVGLLEKARVNLDAAMKYDGERHPSFAFRRGSVASLEGQHETALAYFELALTQNRRVKQDRMDLERVIAEDAVYNFMALEYSALGNTEKAMEMYNAGINISGSKSFELLNNAAIQLASIQEYDKAMEYYNLAMEMQPLNGLIFANAGYAAEKMGNKTLAGRLYDRAYELNPDHRQIEINWKNFHAANK